MDNYNLLWVFVDFHNALITTVNEASGRWNLNELIGALQDHKLRGLALSCARTINENHDFLLQDKSKLMDCIKKETDAYVLASGQPVEIVEPEQLRYLFKSVAEMQIALLQFNAQFLKK